MHNTLQRFRSWGTSSNIEHIATEQVAMCLIFEEGPSTETLQSSIKCDTFKNWSQETIQLLADLLNP